MTGFASRIVVWQRGHGRRDLPWQGTRDPYRIWLSEIMLQQTQVATVLPYYLRFLAAFPDVAALARASIDDVLAHWSGLGYYRRAHHLHAAARTVMEAHGAVFPRDAATLETLPGVGRSTAAAIAAFSSGARVAILDGNVKRVLARHAGVEGWPGAPKVGAVLWGVAQARLPRARCLPRDTGLSRETCLRGGTPSRDAMSRDAGLAVDTVPDEKRETHDDDIEAYTQGMMDLGATVCTRTQPRCGACPVADDCVARLEARTDSLPSPRPARTLPHRDVRVLLIQRGDQVLFERRPAQGIWGGLWSLPECALDHDACAEVLVRFGIVADDVNALPTLEHGFTHFTLTMHPLRLTATQAPKHVAGHDDLAWLSNDAAEATGLPAPIRRLVRSLDLARFRLTPP